MRSQESGKVQCLVCKSAESYNEFSATPQGQLNWTGPIANESEMDSDGMLDWSASERKDYKDCVATVACASPDSFKTHKDTGNGVDLAV